MKKIFTLLMFSMVQLSVFSQNLITNGSFENGTTYWTNLNQDGSVATFSIVTSDKYEGNQSLKVEITTKGTNAWSVQSIHSTTLLDNAKKYTLTLYAKAEAATPLNVVIQNNEYLATSFNIGTEWTKYEWTFTSKETEPSLRLQYPEAGTMYIDAIQLTGESASKYDISVSPATTYQTMIGFGGGLTWYCDQITKSTKKDEIIDLMFNDLGTDILRFKNWYYPTGYPAVTSTDNMEESYFKGHFDATNDLYTLAKQANPNVEVLLSSWTPPSAYKSNGDLELGTLKKDENGEFMYAELGQYYKDVLDHITFNPDYFSFQNEPGFVNAGWGTCEWRPTETAEFPGYDKGIDAVYDAIKSRSFVPKIIAPETENIGSASWNSSLNTFREMTTPLKDKPYVYGYAYHLYNFGSSPFNLSPGTLNIIKNEFGEKPNMMTEFSSANFNWLQTADAIHQTVVEANSSAYIYWELAWDGASNDHAIFKLDANGYTTTDQYFALKHFAKNVDKGYKRIGITGGGSQVKVSGYLNEEGDKVTLVALNTSSVSNTISLNINDFDIEGSSIIQSVAGDFYKDKGALSETKELELPAGSLTTILLDVTPGVPTSLYKSADMKNAAEAYPNPFVHNTLVKGKGSFEYSVFNSEGKKVLNGNANEEVWLGETLPAGLYTVKIESNTLHKTVKIIKK